MKIILSMLLLLGAYFSLAALVSASNWLLWGKWPFSDDAKPFLPVRASVAEVLKNSLATLAGVGFLFSALSLSGFFIPSIWWPSLALPSAAACTLLYFLYLNRFAVLPFAINGVLLWGLLRDYSAMLKL